MKGQGNAMKVTIARLTLVDLHIRDGLPLIHGDEPLIIAAPPATEIDDELALVAT